MTFSAQSGDSTPIGADDLAAALAWWREAGVDQAYSDHSRQWLQPAAPVSDPVAQYVPPPLPSPPPRERIGGDPALWPQDLEAFRAWWLSEPSLDGGQVGQRQPPRGPAGAALMVLVDHAEADDNERLLAGPQGRLLTAILAALGIAETDVYVAAALVRHTPMPDWAALDEAGLGELLRHHVALVAPQRLIVLGSHVSSLLGHDPANNAGFLPDLHAQGRTVPVLVAPELERLAARPRNKARLWQALLEWHAA